MKYRLLFVAMLFGSTPSLLAQDVPITDTSWSTTTTLAIYSKYFGSTNGAVFADETVTQAEFDLNWKKKSFSGSFIFWGSKGFQNNWKGFSDEVDLAASVTYTGKADVSVAFWHYVLVPVALSDVENFSITVAKSYKSGRNTVTPSGRLDVYWPMGQNGPKAGNFFTLAGSHVYSISPHLAINNNLRLAQDFNGAFGFKSGTVVFRYDGGVDVSVYGWTLSPRVIYGGAVGSDVARPRRTTLAFLAIKNMALSKTN